MRKLLFFVFAIQSLLISANKGDKVTYLDTAINVGDLRIIATGGLATDDYIKAKFRFENKGESFIIFNPNKSFYYINGNKLFAKEKELIIPPNGKKNRGMDVKGPNLGVPALSVVIDGLSKTGNEKMINFPDLNAERKEKNTFGNMEVVVEEVDFDKAKKMHVKVKVTNVGNDILILNGGVVELNEDGNTLNNIRKRSNSMMLRKGESEVIALMYQPSSEKGVKKLIWNDAFVSASVIPMDPCEIGLTTKPELLHSYKYFLSPQNKKPEVKNEPVAMNNSRSKDKKDNKKAETKKTENKPQPAPKDKTEVKQPEKKRAEAIQSEGEMTELHAAEVNFADAGGKYYALLIGSSDYADPNIPDLDGLPVNDAEGLAKVLKTNYTFADENVKVLKNPTRREIVIAMDDLSKKVTTNDNVLIFYAGHGHYEDENDIGYWLPTDAEVSNSANWLYNDQLVASIRKIKSLHTLLISDACFSGSIFKNRSISLTGATDVIKKKYQLPSRKAITSGTLKTVPNKSIFIKYLLDRLEKNKDKYFAASGLYQALEAPVGNNSTSLPQYGVINNVGDEGGDFIFIRK